jgi:hypothetical protein
MPGPLLLLVCPNKPGFEFAFYAGGVSVLLALLLLLNILLDPLLLELLLGLLLVLGLLGLLNILFVSGFF